MPTGKKNSIPKGTATGGGEGQTNPQTAHADARYTFNDAKKAEYIAAIVSNGGRKIDAAKMAKVDYVTVYRARKSCPEFAQAEAEAEAMAMEVAENEARRRAIEGCQKTWFDKAGNITRLEVEYSDTILLRLLERMETGQWRQRQQVETGRPGAFDTRADRKAALEKVRAELASEQQPA